MDLSFFTSEAGSEALVPTDLARSLWSAEQMHGVAVSAALSRSLEQELGRAGRDDLRAARYTVDLFRPPLMKPSVLTASLVRDGTRIALADTRLEQDGELVARASAVFLQPGGETDGEAWQRGDRPEPPPEDLAPVTTSPRVPVMGSDELGWTEDFTVHQNASRKRTWQTPVPVLPDEEPSPFVTAASVADATSMVANWGTRGVEFINADVTLLLARLPEGREVGLEVVDRVERDGIAVGSCRVFDRRGAIGTSAVSSLANSRRTVDFTAHDFHDDGTVTRRA